MIENFEDQSVEEPLELEGTEDEFSKCVKSKIKYTRASLLEFNEVEMFRKLPRDFDLLILRDLDGESDGTLEQKSISGNSSVHGPLLWPRWDLGLLGERWDNHWLFPIKESNSQRNCGLERRHVVCPQLPQGSGYDAGVLARNPPKREIFQLSKCENPYRPPHCNKKMPKPLANISEPGIVSSRESDQRVSADSIKGNEKSGYEIPLAGVGDSTKKSLGECEDSWRNNEGNEAIAANETLGEITEDNQLSFDDFWAEILATIHRQQESSISPTNTHADTPDSEVEISFPDEDGLISVDYLTAPENFNINNLESSDDIADSEDEISLPDEDSLISIYDMIALKSSMPTLNSDSLEANKVTSNMAVNIRKNSESLNVSKRGDQSAKVSCTAQSFFHFPGLVTHGKCMLSYSRTSSDIFVPEKTPLYLGTVHTNFTPTFMIPNIAPYYIPTLNCCTNSNFDLQSFQESILTKTKTNDSFFQYSVLQQPNIFPQQHNHLLVDASCLNPMKQVATPELNAMQSLPFSQQATYHGFGKPNAVAVNPIVLGGFGDEEASGFSLWHAQF